jgi:hypothetical protein
MTNDCPRWRSRSSGLMAIALAAETKTEILKSWACDQKELEIASDEDMPERDGGDLLRDMENAIATLRG